MIKLSVIVCTFNRANSLKDTLQALSAQVVPSDILLEIIVVDNNSKDETHPVVEQCDYASPFPIRYVFEPAQGLSHARNAGIRAAKGSVIVFTDDDVLPDTQWIQKILTVFNEENADCVGGRVLPIWEAAPPEWVKENNLLGNLALIDRDCGREVATRYSVNFIYGANMAFKREVFEQCGQFNTSLGRKGKNLISGEEGELLSRVIEQGFKVVYCPQVVVRHKISKDRLKVSYFRRWQYQWGKSMVRLNSNENKFIRPWYIKETLIAGKDAVMNYLKGNRQLGIKKDLEFALRIGQIKEKALISLRKEGRV